MAATNTTWMLDVGVARLVPGPQLFIAQANQGTAAGVRNQQALEAADGTDSANSANNASGTSQLDDMAIGETRVLVEVPEPIDAATEKAGGLALPDVLMIAGIALMAFMLLLNLRKRRLADKGRLGPREQIERTRQHQGMRDDLNQMMVELEALARRFGAQLDAKSMELEQLLDEAESAAQELRRLRNGSADSNSRRVVSVSAATADESGTGMAGTASGLGTGVASDLKSRSNKRNPNGGGIAGLNNQGTHTDDARDEATLARVIRAEAGGDDPLRRRVYEMADSGSSPVQIAQGLNEDVGKVELILALRAG